MAMQSTLHKKQQKQATFALCHKLNKIVPVAGSYRPKATDLWILYFRREMSSAKPFYKGGSGYGCDFIYIFKDNHP